MTSVVRGELAEVGSPRPSQKSSRKNGALESQWRRNDRRWAWFFLGPQAIGIIAFTIIPFIMSIGLSMTDWNGFGPLNFVGLDNFKAQLTDPLFGRAVLNTLLIAFITVPVGLFSAIVVATLLNKVKRTRTLFTVMFFAPVVTSSVAVALIWQQLLRKDGWLSSIIGYFTDNQPDWLNDPKLTLLAVCMVTVWSSLGLNVVIFLAGLQSIPASVGEAASMDGAGPLRSFWNITMPMLSPTIFFQSIIAFISSLQTFDLVFVLVKNAGPDNATRTIVYHIYDLGIAKGQLGLSAAASILLLVLSGIITAIQFGAEKRIVHYES